MFEEEKMKINLLDLIDIKLLQSIQDIFAKAMKVASITVDDKGPITKPSNFTDFCTKYTRNTEVGRKRCNDCDIRWGMLAAARREPVIYNCHAGLTDFAVPIIVKGQHVASILGGQVLTSIPNEKYFREIARQLGVNEDEYIEALHKIKILTPEQVKDAADFLFLVANAISEIGHKNLELIGKTKREKFYRNISETIRSSLDIDETTKKITDIIGSTLKADRCFIVEYDKQQGEFLSIEYEYLSSMEIGSCKDVDLNNDTPRFSETIKRGEKILVNNKEILVNSDNRNFDLEKKILEKYKINSIFSFPLLYRNELLGGLSLHYVNEKHWITNDGIEFLENIADQIAIAIYQSKLYKETKAQAEREKMLRVILETMRNSLDINVLKKTIVTEIGKALGVNVCFILLYDEVNEHFYVDEYSEYRSSDEEKSFIGFDTDSVKVKWFIDKFKKNEELVFSNVDKVVAKHNLYGTPEYYFLKEEAKIKSSRNIPIYYANKLLGYIILEYTKEYKEFTESELSFLRLIAAQAGTAIHQVNLYKELQAQVEREKFGRKITGILGSTLDKNTIKNLFVKNIGEYFKADRVFCSEFDKKTNIYLPVDKSSEYLSSSKEQSFVDYSWDDPSISDYIQPLIEKQDVNIFDWDEYIKQNNKTEGFIALFEMAKVKSSYNMPILYQERIMGYFCIEFTQKVHKFTQEDLELIRNICNKAGIALYHAELYLKAQEAAKIN